jgi:hypothetical protein
MAKQKQVIAWAHYEAAYDEGGRVCITWPWHTPHRTSWRVYTPLRHGVTCRKHAIRDAREFCRKHPDITHVEGLGRQQWKQEAVK